MGPLAQSVEQRTFNPWVVGSIPTGPTYFGAFNLFELRHFECDKQLSYFYKFLSHLVPMNPSQVIDRILF